MEQEAASLNADQVLGQPQAFRKLHGSCRAPRPFYPPVLPKKCPLSQKYLCKYLSNSILVSPTWTY